MRFLAVVAQGIANEVHRWNASQVRRLHQWRYLVALVAIGVCTAFFCFLFERMVRGLDHLILSNAIGYETPVPARARTTIEYSEWLRELGEWREAGAPKADPTFDRVNHMLLLIVPAFGGLCVGLICWGLAPRFQGDGTEVTVYAVHHHAGAIPVSVTLRKLFASVITATFGSSGQEGPITQTGAGVANAVLSRFKFDAATRRKFVIAGMAAGVGALFRVPLGGALYAVEILYRDNEFESEAIMPAFIASIVSVFQ